MSYCFEYGIVLRVHEKTVILLSTGQLRKRHQGTVVFKLMFSDFPVPSGIGAILLVVVISNSNSSNSWEPCGARCKSGRQGLTCIQNSPPGSGHTNAAALSVSVYVCSPNDVLQKTPQGASWYARPAYEIPASPQSRLSTTKPPRIELMMQVASSGYGGGISYSFTVG